jgi:hypothetical protein
VESALDSGMARLATLCTLSGYSYLVMRWGCSERCWKTFATLPCYTPQPKETELCLSAAHRASGDAGSWGGRSSDSLPSPAALGNQEHS